MVYVLGQEHLEDVCAHLSISKSEGNASDLKRKVIRKLSTMDLGGGDEEDDGEAFIQGWFEEFRQFLINLSAREVFAHHADRFKE